jgi:hypothetical protein
VFGANVGTTGTGWLVALIGVRVSLSTYALPMIFVGALAKLLAGGRIAGAGSALAGFALVRAHMGNPYLWYGIAAVVALRLLFTDALPFHAVFDTEALALSAWLWLVGGAALFFLVVEVEKLIIRSSPGLRGSATSQQGAAMSTN